MKPQAILPAIAILGSLMTPGLADSPDPVAGAEIFAESCAGCHGAQARGDGPTSELLSVPVADLTAIAARNEGEFDRVRVIYIIDGRAGLTAHGGPMPMFGGLLTGEAVVIDGEDGSPVTTTKPILDVVAYLEGLQE